MRTDNDGWLTSSNSLCQLNGLLTGSGSRLPLRFHSTGSIGVRPQLRVRSGLVRMCAPETPPPASGAADKQMSQPDELVKLADVTPDFRILMEQALVRLDRKRRLEGKPKYEDIDGMIDAYVEEAGKAGLGWTREDAESEVVRFLKRQALNDEGSPGQNPDDVFIGIFAIIVIYSAVTGFAPVQDLPTSVVSPY